SAVRIGAAWIEARYDRRRTVEDVPGADPEHIMALDPKHRGQIEIILRGNSLFERTHELEKAKVGVKRRERHLADVPPVERNFRPSAQLPGQACRMAPLRQRIIAWEAV